MTSGRSGFGEQTHQASLHHSIEVPIGISCVSQICFNCITCATYMYTRNPSFHITCLIQLYMMYFSVNKLYIFIYASYQKLPSIQSHTKEVKTGPSSLYFNCSFYAKLELCTHRQPASNITTISRMMCSHRDISGTISALRVSGWVSLQLQHIAIDMRSQFVSTCSIVAAVRITTCSPF